MSTHVDGIGPTLEALEQRKLAYRRAIRDTIIRLSMLMVGRVQADKLSGQVLNVRTGLLRRRINSKLDESDTEIAGYVGTNVVYARLHEMGGSIDERVREHMRMAKVAFGRQMKNPHKVLVRAHTRHVTFPERSFLRSTLAEMQPEIKRELASAMERASSGGA